MSTDEVSRSKGILILARRTGMTDARLAAIEELYRAQFRAFVSVATAIVGDADEAFDAVQDAFASAVRRRARFRGDAPLEAWLWRIVLNSARDCARRGRRAPQPILDAEPSRNGHEPASPPTWLLDLTERQRTVVFLRYYADHDYRMIASLLGISEGTVGATLSKAHAALRPRLEEERA
jgi:RNA polymerase sigma-70 factor (ECF subfamily)